MAPRPRRALKGLRLCWHLTVAVAPRIAVASLVLTVASQALFPLAAAAVAHLTDAAAGGRPTAAVWWGVAVGFSLPLAWFLRRAGFLLGHPMMHPATGRADQMLLMLVSSIPDVEHLETPDHVDKLAVLREHKQKLLDIQFTTISAVGGATQFAVTLALLMSVSPWLSLIVVVALPQLWLSSRAEAIQRSATERLAPDLRRSHHLTELLTRPGPGRELRVFGVLPPMLERDRLLTESLSHRRLQAIVRAHVVTAAGSALMAAAAVAAIAFTLQRVLAHQATPGDLMLTMVLTQQVTGTVNGLVTASAQLVEAVRVIGHFLWFLDYAAEKGAPDPFTGVRQTRGAEPPDRLFNGICLDGVSYTYPGRSEPALADVCVHLPAGATVAIVGENGAGKTTLVKLLTRMYSPSTGRITLDGEDIGSFDIAQWRAMMTAAFQDFARFELLLRDTVGVGSLDQLGNEVSITTAVSEAGADGWVRTLPAGFDTQLGLAWSEGAELSGGQWQMLALARSGMRPVPLLAILDEPTATLDPLAEAAVFDRYASTARAAAHACGGIAVLVSHRYSTVRTADLILVLEDGRLVEQGTHQELMARRGWYAEAFALQARGYA